MRHVHPHSYYCTKHFVIFHKCNIYISGDSIKMFRTLGINISNTTKYNNSKFCVLLIYDVVNIMIHLTLPEWQVSQNWQSNYAISLDCCNSSNKMIDMSTIFSHHCSQVLFPNWYCLSNTFTSVFLVRSLWICPFSQHKPFETTSPRPHSPSGCNIFE